ncbi:MAG TPA: Uma2 family endonuclease [Rectinemataceae bacterium]|nr:Uma2 family endonuclease [Rectinemataceae bacterium]
MERMGNPAVDRGVHYTYRHYRTWPDEERWELIDGRAWAMSPAPLTDHQRIVFRFGTYLKNQVEGTQAEAFIAPFDVVIPKSGESDDEADTVVQPDLCVYRDRSKITKRGGRGAPDLVVEVLSPSTSKKDQREKFNLYERSGVLEYWVVDPGNRSVCVYRPLENGLFDDGELREETRDFGPIASTVIEGFTLEPEKLFAGLD